MSSTPFTPDFDKLVTEALDRWHVPGVAFSVVHGDHTFSKGYGIAQQPSTPFTPSTLFYVASTTKAQLCAAWAIYIESEANKSKPKDQQISFSTPLSDIIKDDFVLSDPLSTRLVKLEDALTHRTGMPRHESSYGYDPINTAKAVTRNLRHLPLHNELRTTAEYCNIMYMAASHALEVVTGKPLGEVLRETLWGPLGMEHTYAGYGEAHRAVEEHGEVLAKGHTWSKPPSDADEKDGHLTEEPYMDMPECTGAGYVISTADDYAKWMRCFLDDSSGPLTEDMIKNLWAPRTIFASSAEDNVPFDGIPTYGLGWFVTNYKGHTVIHHAGDIIGAGCLTLLVPDLKFGVSCFGNGDNGGGKLGGLGLEVLDDVLGIPQNERYARKKNEEHVVKMYKDMSDESAKSRSKLYPDAPEKPTTKLTLPMKDYAGKYTHPAYGTLVLEYKEKAEDDERLVCDLQERTWTTIWTFRHVNAEHWMVDRYMYSIPVKKYSKAESRIGADGKVTAFGVAAEPAMADTLIWFERISEA